MGGEILSLGDGIRGQGKEARPRLCFSHGSKRLKSSTCAHVIEPIRDASLHACCCAHFCAWAEKLIIDLFIFIVKRVRTKRHRAKDMEM